MLPSKKQKHKTKIRTGENPQFIESFLLHRVNPEEVNSMGLRVRVYGCERMRRERLIGESIVSFATIDLELETNLWLPLEPRANATVCKRQYSNNNKKKRIAKRKLSLINSFYMVWTNLAKWFDK